MPICSLDSRSSLPLFYCVATRHRGQKPLPVTERGALYGTARDVLFHLTCREVPMSVALGSLSLVCLCQQPMYCRMGHSCVAGELPERLVQAVVKILVPFAGPRVREAMSHACAKLFREYTNALTTQFSHYRDSNGALPQILGRHIQQRPSPKCAFGKHEGGYGHE